MLHGKALHGNPFDSHTLAPVIAGVEALTEVETRRIHVDEGYRGHNHQEKFRVWISGQVRRVSASIRREMRRRGNTADAIRLSTNSQHLLGMASGGQCGHCR